MEVQVSLHCGGHTVGPSEPAEAWKRRDMRFSSGIFIEVYQSIHSIFGGSDRGCGSIFSAFGGTAGSDLWGDYASCHRSKSLLNRK